MKAKLIFQDGAEAFEKELNNFIETVKVIDIKFTTDQPSSEYGAWFNALVLYEDKKA